MILFLRLAAIAVLLSTVSNIAAAPITRIWLTHPQSEPTTLMVNWETKEPGPSRVDYGTTESLGESASNEGPATLHHVEIPFPQTGLLHYQVTTGGEQSAIHAVKSYDEATLRVAATANWQLRPGLDGLMKDDPHILLSCGDMVLDVTSPDAPGAPDTTTSFSLLIDRYPALFARVPFLPALGNHDRQIRYPKKGDTTTPLYDIEATAFRSFFPLPDDGRIYHFDIPAFGLRLAALDLSHISDRGTHRQSCLDFSRTSEQFRWFREVVRSRPQRFMVSYFNESGPNMRRTEQGAWETLFRQNSVVLSGFGSFSERSEVKGLPYFTSALKVLDSFRDSGGGKFYAAKAGYTLLHVPKEGPLMAVELKTLDGALLDRTEWPSSPSMGNRLRNAP